MVRSARSPRQTLPPSAALRFTLSTALTLIALGLPLHAAVQFPQTIVGNTSTSQTIPITVTATGQLTAVNVLTSGVSGLDFAGAGAGNCATGTSVTAGQICSFPVSFQPRFPGQRVGAIVLVNSSGLVLGSTSLAGAATGPLGLFVPGTIQTVAGDSQWIYRGDGQPATSSPIFLPFGIAVDGGGDLFIADSNNNRIRRVDAASRIMSTYAGNGNAGASGDGAAATSASLNQPTSIAIDGAGNLYFADSANHAVRRVDAASRIITTVAGRLGIQGYTGDNGPATSALLNTPDGLALDSSGVLYIADSGNNVVRRVDPITGQIIAFAGNHAAAYTGDGGPAISASLSAPWSVTVSSIGEVYIADQSNHAIRKVALNGTISTVIGNGTSGFSGDGGPGSGATLNSPASVAIDVAGNLYIADSGNNRVRKVNAASGIITTVVGNSTESFSGDGGPADQAGLYGPYALVLDSAGDLLISDVFHNRIREISSTGANLNYPTMRVNRISATQNVTLENDGNAPLNIAAVQAVTNAQVDPATTCLVTQPLAISYTCVVGAQFAPTVTGAPVQGLIRIASDSPNIPQTINLSGTVLTLDPATATLQSSGSPSAFGAPVTFTATLTSPGITPSGSISFLDGNTSIGTTTLNSSGVGQITTASLALGSHTITVSYAGDTNNAPGTSGNLTQVVKNGTTVLLQSSNNPSSAQSPVTFTANAVAVSGTATGLITFLDGSNSIGTANLDSSGAATLTTSNLGVGSHRITASYSGDANSLGNTSGPVTQIVQKSSSATTLSSSNTDSTFSIGVTFTATVTSQTAGIPTGTVSFMDGSSTVGTTPLNASGVATLTTGTLAVGSHSLTSVYSGDSNSSISTSPTVAQTVEKITTSTVLSSSPNPSAAGAAVHLSATVTPSLTPAGTPLTGAVTFTDGSNTLGTGTITGGVATLDVSALALGPHTIAATYSGAANFSASTSAAVTEMVQLATSSATLSASPSPAIAGANLTFTATVTSTGSTPTGSVTFKDGAIVLGQATLNPQGIATFPISTLGTGTHAITAIYAGDTNNQSTSASLSLGVQQATTSVTFTSSGSPVTVGLPVTFHATVSGNGGAISGSATFYDGSTPLGSATLNGSGAASFTTTSLPVGSHTITATYTGDPNNASATSTALTEVVQKATTTTSISSTASTTTQGSPVQFAAQVASNSGTPGGSVQFFDGTTSLGTSTLNAAGVATYNTSSLIVGQHNITAVYGGDTNDNASASAILTQVIQPITIVGISADRNPASTGALVTFTAGVSGANTIPTGTVTFHDGPAVLGVSNLNGAGVATLSTATLGAGTHTITASYAGDANNNASTSQPYTETLQQATTQTVLALSSTTAAVASPVTISATVTGTGGTPGGHVTLLDGATVLSIVNLTSTGTASSTFTNLALGPHTITASYSGDPNDAASASSPQVLTIQREVASLTIASVINPTVGGQPVTFTANLRSPSATVSGSITWSDGSTVVATTPVSGNGGSTWTTSSLTPGQHTLTASYSGDGTNSPATSSPLIQTVQQATSTITFTSSRNPATLGDTVSFATTVIGTGSQPTGSVTLKDGSAVVATGTVDASGNATLTTSSLSAGSHTLTAVYAGDSFHAAAQSTPITELIYQSTASSLTSSANPSVGGNAVLFTATIAVTTGVPVTGIVTFKDGAAILGSSPINSSGVATFSTSSLAPGQHGISATYSGDTLNQPSATTVLVQTVQSISTTTSLASSANPASAGSPITLTAQITGTGVAPSGSVTFQDGSVVLGTANVSGSVATLTTSALTPGQHVLLAIYAGDTHHLTSTSNPLLESVNQHTATTLTSSANPAVAGTPINLAVSVANGTTTSPTGSVSLLDGATTLATAVLSGTGSASFTLANLTVGQHMLTAVYSGDPQNGPATSNPVAETIQQGTSAVALTSSANPALIGAPVTLAVVVTGTGSQPAGNVVIKDGATVLATVTLDAHGLATTSTSTLAAGSHTLTATYAGDANHPSAQSLPLSELIDQATTIALTSSNNPSLGGSPVVFTATIVVTTGIPVTGTVVFHDGSNTLGSSPISTSGVATFTTSSLTPGQHGITATYSGDSLNQASPVAGLVQTVSTVSTVTTLASTANPAIFGNPLTLTAQISGTGVAPTGSVTFQDGSAILGTGTVNNGAATLTTSALAPGQHVLVAIYNGDTDHVTSTSTPLLETVQQRTTISLAASANPSLAANAVIFSIAVNTGTGTVTPTGSVTLLDGSTNIGTAILSATGTASFTLNNLSVGQHSISATYTGDGQNFAGASPVLTETVGLHTSTNVLTVSSANVVQGDPLTLVATLSGDGPVPPSGSIVFSAAGKTLGTAALNASGIATLTVSPALGAYSIIATYQGDGLYKGSVSAAVSTTVVEPTHFTITLSPNTMSLQSRQHNTIQLSFASVQGFTDILALGCVGLPNAATCTFSSDHVNLAAGGKQTVSLTIDTGSPLTAGGVAENRTSTLRGIALCILPGGLLLGFTLRRSQKSRKLLSSLLALLLFAVSIAVSGCGGLQVNGTAPGSYTFHVTAIGSKTAATQSAPMTLTVTQ